MSADDKVLGLFIGHTESRNRYNIIHPDPRNIGIVGATPSQWGRFLKIRKIPINSLRAGVVIFNYYLKEECKQNYICAMEKYKGILSAKTKPMAIKFIKQYKEVLALDRNRRAKEIIKKKGN